MTLKNTAVKLDAKVVDRPHPSRFDRQQRETKSLSLAGSPRKEKVLGRIDRAPAL
jgi:hypothetical protein